MLTLEKSLKETDKKIPWTPEKPLREIGDKEIRNIFINYAKYLLDNLEKNYLETGYIRNPPDTGPIVGRMAINQNPKWYRDLWNENTYYYKSIGRRKIKRKKTSQKKKT